MVEKAGVANCITAMTNPTLFELGLHRSGRRAAALSGSGDALQAADVDKVNDQMKEFFKGWALTAGSSGWLADQYVLEQDHLDGIINYQIRPAGAQ